MRRQRTSAITWVLLVCGAVLAACTPPGGGGGPSEDPVHRLIHPGSDRTELALGERPMSADGRFVVCRSAASQRDNIQLWDRSTGSTTDLTPPGSGSSAGLAVPSISADGSAVLFTASGGPIGPGTVADGEELFRYSTGDGVLTRLAVPDALLDGPVVGATISGDGDSVVASTGHRVLRWTGSSGFEVLIDDAARTHLISSASLSANGRYLSMVRFTPDATTPTLQLAEYVVRDLQTGSTHASWTGPLWNPGAPHQVPYEFRIGATSDTGAVIFSHQVGGPVLLLDVTASTLGGGPLTGTSGNGRFYSFTGNPEMVPVWEAGASFIRDRVTQVLTRVSGPGMPVATQVRAVSDDGRYVLLFSSDPAVVPSPGYQLWDREA